MLFLLSHVAFNNFSTIQVEIENARPKLALATGALITVANDAMEMLPLVANKKKKDLSK